MDNTSQTTVELMLITGTGTYTTQVSRTDADAIIRRINARSQLAQRPAVSITARVHERGTYETVVLFADSVIGYYISSGRDVR